MSRDQEIVEDYKRIFREMLDTPSLRDVEGVWHLYEKKGRASFISQDKETWGGGIPAPVWFRQRGWAVTPVIVHKIVADR